jgi:HlyD family secretion protein
MDRPLDGKIKRRKKIITYSLLSILVIIVIAFFIFRDNSSKLNVEQDKITIEDVKKDIFQDYISVIGAVEPLQTVYLDATEGGRVDEIFIREGTMVKEGDIIMRLSNDNLLLEISNYEAEVARAINDLKTMRVNLENQQISNRTQLVDLYYDLLKLERTYKNNKTLVADKYISQDDYLLSKENYERANKHYELLSRKNMQDSLSINVRISASEESVESMQKNMAIIRNRLSKLSIQAPVNGELASLVPELGQVIGYGTRIGSINILDSYKLKAEIDEHYIARIKLKLKAFCDFDGNDYTAVITKVYPEVKEGKFSVDMEFSGKLPQDMRIGQTSRIRLELGASETTILVARGGFYQSTGGQWMYVVDKGGNFAIKRNIKIGRYNPLYYEVLEGLTPGEKVITSGYENFGNVDKLILKQ